MRGWYGIVELTHAAYPSLPQLPADGEQAFLAVCLAPEGQLPPVILDQAVPPIVVPEHVPATDAVSGEAFSCKFVLARRP